MKHIGAGTQKVEQELQELFPDTRILRMDADTAAGGHEKILRQFEKEKIPILLGTQMVAKGLDFENVTLVGVLSADPSKFGKMLVLELLPHLVKIHELPSVIEAGARKAGVQEEAFFAEVCGNALAADGKAHAGLGYVHLNAGTNGDLLAEIHICFLLVLSRSMRLSAHT